MFVLIFLVREEKSLIKKLRLILKFLTSSTGKQIITKLILPNISRSKGNQTMEFGQLIEIFLLKNYSKIRQETIFRPLAFFKNALNEIKTSTHHLIFNIFWLSLTWTYNKVQTIWIFRLLMQRYEEGLELVPAPHFVYNSSK